MRIALSVVAVLLSISVSMACAATSDPTTEEQKTLYALGLAVSQSVDGFNLSESELEFVKAGLTDGVLKRPRKVEIQAFVPKIQQLQQARAATVADAEKKAGAVFLAKAAQE